MYSLAWFCRLKPLDIEVMKHLGSRVNLIPVIAKADTLTPRDLAQYKLNVSTTKTKQIDIDLMTP
jgi:septin family protein